MDHQLPRSKRDLKRKGWPTPALRRAKDFPDPTDSLAAGLPGLPSPGSLHFSFSHLTGRMFVLGQMKRCDEL